MKARPLTVRRLVLLALFAFLLTASSLIRPRQFVVTAQTVAPQGTLVELSLDDGQPECAAGTGDLLNGKNFGWANKLTPTVYPATLRTITIGFQRNIPDREVKRDALYRIVVYADPENDGPAQEQTPLAAFTGRVRGTESFMTFNLVTPVTIDAGSFVVGAIDDDGFGPLPAMVDIPGKSAQPGTESYLSFDGGVHWRTQASIFGSLPNCTGGAGSAAGSWLIRATIETGTAETPTITKIKDPAAVEPWAVAVSANGAEAFVANYVSDNLTIVKTSDNSFINVPVGDGTGGAPDGPYGIAVDAANNLYVTLFGSNTILTKEFPIDYATVAAGRVAVLSKQANGTYAQTFINVGKGPKTPALGMIDGTAKLYVPCGGDGRVDVINTATKTKIREIAVGVDPSSCTFSLGNSKLYVTNAGDGTISVIDTHTDTKIKDIVLPDTAPPAPGLPPLPALKNPVAATVSPTNGNLYVAFNDAAANPNGAIVEIDTCSDSFLRFVIDPATVGTPAGSAGATGIAAPTAPLTRNTTSGLTNEAGGGGGGIFGIASFLTDKNSEIVFTNDGLGIIGVIDSRIDQIVTAPAIAAANCPKLRGLATRTELLTAAGNPNQITGYKLTSFVACGQPDSSLLIVSVPSLRENIATVPVIDSLELGKKQILVKGKGFAQGTRLEVVDPASGICLSFTKAAHVNLEGTEIVQKAIVTDGRKARAVIPKGTRSPIRIINPDGTVRVYFPQ
ncbi:MAG: YncE family protein [Acidobacteriota bacterium]